MGASLHARLACFIFRFLRRPQLAAWLGLTPSQYSSGGKSKLGRITKAGDS
ncbi:transposase, partial [Citrobacter freundii]